MKGRIFFISVLLFLVSPVFAGPHYLKSHLKKMENDSLKREVERLRMLNDSLHCQLEKLKLVEHELGIEDSEYSEFEFDDSLVRNWYVSISTPSPVQYDVDSLRFSSNVPDEVFISRLQAINSYIPLSFNEKVKNCCILYSEKMTAAMGQIMGLSEYYWPVFDEILSHYGLPLELKALVIVESMYRPTATSRVGAKGLWQFMYGTAKGYGLAIDSFVDERMDPYKSTVAAARYLRDAYNTFGDWLLAIASYNCGGTNVSKAIRRSDGKRNFWEIYDFLPRETRGYVPAFIGALYATHYYKEYGIVPVRDVAVKIPVDTISIHKNLHFAQIEECVGVPVSTLQALNPQYMHNIVPGNTRPYILRIPMEKVGTFLDAGDSLYFHKQDVYLNPVQLKKIEDGAVGQGNRITYKVKSGDVLGRIATKYGVTVAQIKKWNGLKSNTIRIGQKLIIYTKR